MKSDVTERSSLHPPQSPPPPGNEAPLAPPLPPTSQEGSSPPDRESYLLDSDVVPVSRATIRWYYVVLTVTAVSCFCLGWLINRRDSPQPKSPVKQVPGNARVLVSGQIRYGRANGLPLPDAGAVVIALPANATLERRIPIEGLRPWDEDSAVAQVNRQRLADFGAAWVRAADDGTYSLVLPGPGQYWVLIISNNLARSKAALELANRGIPELDSRQLSQYFERPGDLIASQAYRWSLETVSPSGLTLNHNFQTDAELGLPEVP